MPADLRTITDFEELIAYLRDELNWPVEDYKLDQLTFEYDADELGLKDEEAEKLKDGTIRQLRPLPGGQPFGIFFVEFGQAKLPVVVLRRILNALVIKKRNSANPADRQRWDAADILFISAFGESDDREIAFAHFHKDPDTTEFPILRVLGWDGSDTPLKTKHVAEVLKNRLHWPENAADQDAWRKQWRGAFRHRLGHVIKTSSDLADALAHFARKIRDAATTIMAHESEAKGQLRKLHRAFQSALIHDLKEEDFADTYAQTVTYGLLTAAISRTEMSEGRHGTALTQEDITAMVPVTNPFLKEMLQEFLKVGGRKGGVDFDELGINEVVELLRGDETDLPAILRDFGNRKPGEDPVIHFYEHFLAAYNKKLRIQRGVFYTPQPIVSYIVRSVHELLQTEFHLEHGLASTITWGEFIQKSLISNPQSPISLPPLTDLPGETKTISPDEPFVQILDPATGTATFLVETIDIIHKHLKERWRPANSEKLPGGSPHFKSFSDYWNHYVPNHLLPRLHGYELMMAPYAIAHMKIGLKLAETGYHFATEERARIYLTNALEKPDDRQAQLIGFDALAHEAAAVNKIKRHKRFTVVIGNPPYTVMSANLSDASRSLIEAYRFADGERLKEKSMLRLEMHLQDDYIKFFRISEQAISAAGAGVLGLISNHSFLNNPTLRGMRWNLLQTFSTLHVFDLHGNPGRRDAAAPEPDENVFDILQGVAISVMAKVPSRPAGMKLVRADLTGERTVKYRTLAQSSAQSTPYKTVDSCAPFYLFTVQDAELRSEYWSGVSLVSAMPTNSVGIVTGRDGFATDITKQVLRDRIEMFCDSSRGDSEIRKLFDIRDAGGYILSKRRKFVVGKSAANFIHRVTYRPFDYRWIAYSRGFLTSDQRNVMRHILHGGNMALVTARSNKSASMNHFFCSKNVTETKCGESTTQSCVFPLYTIPDDGLALTEGPCPNFSNEFLRDLAAMLSLFIDKSTGLPAGLTPEDIFHYAYAVFHSPGYRSRYAEFLKIDFPRLPLTGDLELFRTLARLGGELTALHLLDSPKLAKPITEFIGHRNPEVEKPSWSDDTVWVDKKQTIGFQGVAEDVWNFHIGGYQVCQKWLKDRKGRTLTPDDIAHYHKIVIALTETIRLMAEIDEVIESHGGWPGAFHTSPAEATASEVVIASPEMKTERTKQTQPASDEPRIPGELFGVEGELKSAKKAKAALEVAIPQPPHNDTAPRGDVDDKNEVMSVFREVLTKQGACDRESLIQRAAHALGYQRVRANLAEKLKNAIRTAKRRGIVYEDQGLLRLDVRTIDQWDRAHLKTQFLAAVVQNGRVWIEREEAIRALARWLGFRRTGYIIIETARSLINGLLRDGSIEKDGQDWIRRV